VAPAGAFADALAPLSVADCAVLWSPVPALGDVLWAFMPGLGDAFGFGDVVWATAIDPATSAAATPAKAKVLIMWTPGLTPTAPHQPRRAPYVPPGRSLVIEVAARLVCGEGVTRGPKRLGRKL
jgi:hypothetical protein